jgi:hypothetical protein
VSAATVLAALPHVSPAHIGVVYVVAGGRVEHRLALRPLPPATLAAHLSAFLDDALAGREAVAVLRLPHPRTPDFQSGLLTGAVIGVLAATCESLTMFARGERGRRGPSGFPGLSAPAPASVLVLGRLADRRTPHVTTRLHDMPAVPVKESQ